MNFEKEKLDISEQEMSLEELQAFVNNPELDLPELRRDISKPKNLKWLSQNIWIRNEVPKEIVAKLKKEFVKSMQK